MKGKNNTDWNKQFRDWEAAPEQEGGWDSPSPDLWDRVAQDLPPTTATRPRPWWLGFLAVALVGLVALLLTPSTAPVPLLAFPIPLADNSPAEAPATMVVSATDLPSAPTTQADPTARSAKAVRPTLERATTPPAETKELADETLVTNPKPSSLANLAVPGTSPASIAQRPGEGVQKASETAATPRAELTSTEEEGELDTPLAPFEDTESGQGNSSSGGSPANQYPPQAAATLAGETSRGQPLRPLAVAALPTPKFGVQYDWPAAPQLPAITPPPLVRVAQSGQASWALTTYALLPLDQGLEHTRRNWQVAENQRSGLGLSLRGTASKGWFGQVGLQYEAASYTANTRFLRILNPATEREDNDQLVSDYDLDANLLKSSGAPTSVTLERSRDQQVPENLRIVFQAETEVQEQHIRVPLYLGYQLELAARWGLQFQVGAVINQSSWERRTTQVTALASNLRVREVRFPERVTRQESGSAQLALGAGLHWQPLPHWQVGLHWQRIGTNEQAPVVLQQVEQQLLLGVGYRW